MSCAASEEFDADGHCFESMGDMAAALGDQLSAGMERLVARLGEGDIRGGADVI